MPGRVRRGLTFANVCSFLALVIALGTGTAYAANTVFSEDIVNGEVKTVDIHSDAVTSGKIAANAVASSELAPNAVGTAEVANNSLTVADIAGASINGTISLSGIPNGRCSTVSLNVSGARVGEVPLVTIGAPIQNGIVLYGMRVASTGHVEVAACNFSGGAMDPISDFPVHVITIG